jgi:hypothetical protein
MHAFDVVYNEIIAGEHGRERRTHEKSGGAPAGGRERGSSLLRMRNGDALDIFRPILHYILVM